MCHILKYYGYVVDEGAVLFITIRSDVHLYSTSTIDTVCTLWLQKLKQMYSNKTVFTLTNTVKGPKGALTFLEFKILPVLEIV